jgi:hypothetical protein
MDAEQEICLRAGEREMIRNALLDGRFTFIDMHGLDQLHQKITDMDETITLALFEIRTLIEVIRYRGVCLLGKGYFHEAFHYATLAEGFSLIEKTMTEKRQKKMTQFAD